MSTYPNRHTRIPRHGAATQRYGPPRNESNSKWLLWTVLGIGLAGAIVVVDWRLNVQAKMQETEKKVSALLASADELIMKDQEDEAEAAMREALELQPGDVRCEAVIERINTKRGMIHQKKSTISGLALAQAEQLATSDVAAAMKSFVEISKDEANTEEARKTASDRAKALKGGVCTLRVPADWPSDAVLSIDNVVTNPKKDLVEEIMPGKHTIGVTRFGFHEPDAIVLEFKGLEPMKLPTVQWLPRGAKVFITSKPAGSAVWRKGKDTGKVTPCTIEDVSDGPIEFLLKHSEYADTTVKGEVKDRQPAKLSATLEPLPAPAP